MQLKVMIFQALLYARNQGGSESIDDFFTYARKFMMKQDNTYRFSSTLNAMLLCSPSTALSLVKQEPSIFTGPIKQLLAATEALPVARLFDTTAKSFAEDL